MFSFSWGLERHVDVGPFLRRICDCTAPNSGRSEQLERVEYRYNRALPALVWPWQDGQVVAQQGVTAITKDVNDHGIGLILNEPFSSEELVIGLMSDVTGELQPWFFLGHLVRSEDMGAGYRLLGVQITKLLNYDRPECVRPLYPQTERLLPAAACSVVT